MKKTVLCILLSAFLLSMYFQNYAKNPLLLDAWNWRSSKKDVVKMQPSAVSKDNLLTQKATVRSVAKILADPIEWNFDTNADGWIYNDTQGSVTAGIWTINLIGGDPWVALQGNPLPVDPAIYQWAEVRLKNSTSGTSAMFFFNNGGWAGVPIQVKVNDPDFTTYILDLRNQPGWSGALNTLRIDVSEQATSGTVSIDFIRLLSENPAGDAPEPVWNFDTNADGWIYNDAQGSVTDSIWTINITGADPWVAIQGNPLPINPTVYQWAEIRLKNSTPGTSAMFFFNNGGWAGVPIQVKVNDPDFTTYVLDLRNQPGWSGALNTLRIDVSEQATSGNVSIDYFRLLKDRPTIVASLPGVVEAENFDGGGEGAGYHDLDVANRLGQYRPYAGVDIENCAEGGYNVAWIDTGEWLAYTVNVAKTGIYKMDARVSSVGIDGKFHVEFDGLDKTGLLSVPNTGGWQNWQTVTSATMELTAGLHLMKFWVGNTGFNLNKLTIRPVSNLPQTPFYGTAMALPGTIQVEDFDKGGEDVSCHDADEINQFGQYRPDESVDIEVCAAGGFNVAGSQTEEWLEYTVKVAKAGNYVFEPFFASASGGGRFHVEFNGIDKTGPIVAYNTGNWQNWQSLRRTVALTAGTQVMRVFIENGGVNLDKFTFSPVSHTPPVPGANAPQVALFYFSFFGHHFFSPQFLSPIGDSWLMQGQTPAYSPTGISNFWGKPLWAATHGDGTIKNNYVFYFNQDTNQPNNALLDYHADLITQAGVDFVVLDFTNGALDFPDGPSYISGTKALCKRWAERLAAGLPTPKIIFFVRNEAALEVVQNTYLNVYRSDLFYNYLGKKFLLVAQPFDHLGHGDPGQPAVPTHGLFANYTTRHCWGLDNSGSYWQFKVNSETPPPPFYYNGQPEQMTAPVSTQATYMTTDGVNPAPGAVGRQNGAYFSKYMDAATKAAPKFVFIHSWNEWAAGNWGLQDKPNIVDQWLQEYSSDIEPMAGGHGYQYYFLMKQKIAEFKGKAFVPNRIYRVVSKYSGKVMHVPSNDNTVHQWERTCGLNQQWKIEEVEPGYYKLTVQHSGKVLEVENASLKDNAVLRQGTWSNGNHQKFAITEIGNGNFKITAKHSGKALEVNGNNVHNQAAIKQKTYTGAAHQQWRFDWIPTSPSARVESEATDDDEKVSNSLTVYPNPAAHSVQLDWIGLGEGALTLTVLNLQGIVVYEKIIANQGEFLLSTTTLSNGLYTVRLRNNQSVATQKLLINR
ncbi:MAG: RICIN domain-containing protein [Bacteroidota bacterium]